MKNLEVGEDYPADITFDVALYEKAIQLLYARPEIERAVIPRLRELHRIMAALRLFSTSVKKSGQQC